MAGVSDVMRSWRRELVAGVNDLGRSWRRELVAGEKGISGRG